MSSVVKQKEMLLILPWHEGALFVFEFKSILMFLCYKAQVMSLFRRGEIS